MSVKTITEMNTKSHPCITNPDYNFYKCVETFFYQQQGCQFPWNSFKALDTPICSNLTYMNEIANEADRCKGSDRDEYSNLQRIEYTMGKCVLACNNTIYRLNYINNQEEMKRFRSWNPLLNEGNYSLVISLENFLIEHRAEYLACDTTCIVGELGGNLGYFLGGSLLALFDIIVMYISKAWAKLWEQ